MIEKSVLNNLQGILGEKGVSFDTENLDAFSVDGVIPQAVLFPSSVEQVSEVMKLASKESLSVVPWGAGTKIALGNQPASADIILSTQNLNNIIEHAASDLVATTQAGISLSSFQSELNKQNQFLALDPPHIEQGATIGGIIATNDSGPKRLRYGTAREFLIGLKVVQADGKVFKGGSKVVKNVAGYDLPKLYVGSLGTLGIIVEATFRLYPIAEYSETYIASFANIEEAHESVMTLLGSDLVLTSLEMLSPDLATAIAERNEIDFQKNNYTLVIGISNVERAVKEQMTTVKAVCEEHNGNGYLVDGTKEQNLWSDLRDFPRKIANPASAVCKASVLVTQIPKLLDKLEKLSNENGVKAHQSVRAANGICIIALEGEKGSILSMLLGIRSFVSTIGGHVVILEAPIDIKSNIDVWGDIGSGKQIMRSIKHNFDPDNLLNPGRYI